MDPRRLRVAHGVGACLFIFGAAVQLNDPDPLRWMAIYLGATLASGLGAIGGGGRILPAVVGLVAAVWALIWLPGVIRGGMPQQIVTTFKMMGPEVEEARELGGLVLISVWMAVLGMAGPAKERKLRGEGRP